MIDSCPIAYFYEIIYFQCNDFSTDFILLFTCGTIINIPTNMLFINVLKKTFYLIFEAVSTPKFRTLHN